MCDIGIRRLLQTLPLSDVDGWEPIHDGFGTRPSRGHGGPRRDPDLRCPECKKRIIVVWRELVTDAYSLPDAAIYQALKYQSLCIALGVVSEKTKGTPGRREDLWRWQGLLWHVYGVAFAVVSEGAVGEWCPADFPERAPDSLRSELSCLACKAAAVLARARRDGRIPVGHNSRGTQREVLRVLEPAFGPLGYVPIRRPSPAKAPYHGLRGHPPDGAFVKPQDETRIAIEVKVNEDWDHPLVQPLTDLLEYDAVFMVRVPQRACDPVAEVREWIGMAERKLRETGRARFIYIWPAP